MARKASGKSWDAYAKRQRRQRKNAYEEMFGFVLGAFAGGIRRAVLYKRALDIATRNGAASAALACEWYDAMARESRAKVPRAAPVVVANLGRIRAQVENAAHLADIGDAEGFANACGTAVMGEVKRSASDTMLANAKRDGAEFAWIPQGDETCSFCTTLASNGWVRARQSTAYGDHADHIHPNCDCEFAIRFGGQGGVEGYDPQKYLDEYNAAPGISSRDKINAMRRERYANDDAYREKVLWQQRERYAATHPHEDGE